MSNEPSITVTGNLTADPELRYIASGTAVASFTVASTPRTFDRQAGQWADGQPLFLRCTCWRQQAENVTESLSKGDRVVATGRLRQRSFDAADGGKPVVIELAVDDIGASLRYATAKIIKADRNHGGDTRQQAAAGTFADGTPLPEEPPC